MAADVALLGLVPAQQDSDDTRSELPQVPAPRSSGCQLPAEDGGNAEVGLGITLMTGRVSLELGVNVLFCWSQQRFCTI